MVRINCGYEKIHIAIFLSCSQLVVILHGHVSTEAQCEKSSLPKSASVIAHVEEVSRAL